MSRSHKNIDTRRCKTISLILQYKFKIFLTTLAINIHTKVTQGKTQYVNSGSEYFMISHEFSQCALLPLLL